MSCMALGASNRFLVGVLLTAAVALQARPAHRPETLHSLQNSIPSTSLQRYARHDSGRAVLFAITIEEQGRAGPETGWSMRGEARFALLPSWDGSRGVDPGAGLTAEQKLKLGLQVAASAEDLFELRGSLLELKEGEIIQFYRKESEEQGRGWQDTNRHSWVGNTRDGTSTNTLDGLYSSTSQDDLADTMDAQLVRTKTGARLQFRWWLEPGWEELGVSASLCGFSSPEASRVLTFDLTDEDLRNWGRVTKTSQGIIRHEEDPDVSGTMMATLTTAPAGEDKIEVTVNPEEEDYAAWIPEGNDKEPEKPGRDLLVNITVHKKDDDSKPRKARLSISIPYVSRNRGVCANWPQGASEEEGLRFREEDFPKKEGLLFKDRTHVESDVLLEKASIRVYSYDYGAWGTLRITARDADGREVKVKVRGKDSPDLDIPLDEDANRIADAWQRDKSFGHSLDEDEDYVAGQDEKGDGLTLYNEYRGMMVLDGNGKREFRRLQPDLKEMFLLDPDNAFPLAKWEQITAIRAHRLSDSLVHPAGNPGPGKSPLVNFNAEDKENHPVFALMIRVRTDDPKDNYNPAFAESYEPGGIRNALGVSVFPARFDQRIEEDFAWLNTAILDPDSVEGQELRTDGPSMEIPFEDARQARSRLVDPALRKTIAVKLQAAVVLHEVGHICGLDDHDSGAPANQKDLARACLMFLQGPWGRRRSLVHTALGRGDPDFAYPYRNFCREVEDPGYHCYRTLKIKDW